MKQAPLQLLDYSVQLIRVEANRSFDRDKPSYLAMDLITVNSCVTPIESVVPDGKGTAWEVELEIEQKIPKGKNVPYAFKLKMDGLVMVHPALEGERLDRVVASNGPALLFGAAREVIRAATACGPYQPLVIPSTNFLPDPDNEATKVLPDARSKGKEKESQSKASKKTAKKKGGSKAAKSKLKQ